MDEGNVLAVMDTTAEHPHVWCVVCVCMCVCSSDLPSVCTDVVCCHFPTDYDWEMYLIMQELSYPVPHSTLAVVETYFYHLCTDNNRPYL